MGEEAGAITDRASQWRKHDSYMKAFKGNQVHLDSIDCGDDTAVAEYYNFEPARTLQILIEKAVALNISPDNFHKDMNFLIKSETEKPKCEVNKIPKDSAKRYNDFLDLQEKYGVKSAGNEPDSVTLSRIRFMFPHYTIECFRNNFLKRLGEIYIPDVFSIPEFGALIPTGRILKEDTREALIILHLYCLEHEKSFNNSNIPHRTRQIFLKRIIQSSLLSDDRKVTFLENIGVLNGEGALQRKSQSAIDSIRDKRNDFLKKISWNLIN